MYGFGKMGSTILGAGAPPSGASARSSRPRPLTILLHPPEYDERHVGGANALALAPRFDGGDGDAQLYTGGRDGTVRAWDVSEKSNKGGGSACVATHNRARALRLSGHGKKVTESACGPASVPRSIETNLVCDPGRAPAGSLGWRCCVGTRTGRAAAYIYVGRAASAHDRRRLSSGGTREGSSAHVRRA